jgi:hypothetical protein
MGGWQELPTKKEPVRKTVRLHSWQIGKRLIQNALPKDIKFLAFNSWRVGV